MGNTRRAADTVYIHFSTFHSLNKFIPIVASLFLISACGGGGGSDGNPLDQVNNSGNTTTTPTTPTTTSGNLSINLTQPTSIDYGAPASLSLDAEGATGTVTYSLVAAPAGMSIDSVTGDISYTPAGLRFGADMTVLFTASVQDDNETVTETYSLTVSDTAASQPLVRSNMKGPSRPKSIHIGDFDGVAGNEILTTDNKSLVYILKWDAALSGVEAPNGDFYQQWVYPFSLGSQAHIDAIDAEDVDQDGSLDILVLNGNTVNYIDGATRGLTHQYQVEASDGLAIASADIDEDTVVEIVTLVAIGTNEQQIHVFSLPSPLASSNQLTLEWSSAVGNYGTDMVIANADADDTQFEIVTSGGYVFDGVGHNDEWTASKPVNGFGTQIVAADVDGDTLDEIVGLHDSGVIEVYSPQHQSDLFGQLDPLDDPETTRCAITVSDLDSDGFDEVYAAGCLDGGSPDVGGREYLNILTAGTAGAPGSNAAFSNHVWERIEDATAFYDDRLHGGFSSLAIGDVDGDGQADAFWSNRDDEDHWDAFTALTLSTNSNPYIFPGSASLLAQSIGYGLFDTPFTGAMDFDFDGTTHYATFMSRVNPAEINADGDTEYAIGARVAFVDYATGAVNISARLTATDATLVGNRLMAADLTGKGQDQLILASGYYSTGINDDVTAFQIADFNGTMDDTIDLHLGWSPEATITPEFFAGIVADNLPVSFDLADVDGDSLDELVGFVGNYLFSYDFTADAGSLNTPRADGQWQSIRIDGNGVDAKIADLDNDGIMELVHLTDTRLYLRKRDDDVMHSGSLFYDNIYLSSNVFQGTSFNAMQIMDIDGDNMMEIIVGSSDASGSTIYLLDNTATELARLSIAGEVTDFQLGPGGTTLLASWSTEGDENHISTSYISEIAFSTAPQQVIEILRSPPLLGDVSANSMNYGPAGQLLIGTEYGMYITQ